MKQSISTFNYAKLQHLTFYFYIRQHFCYYCVYLLIMKHFFSNIALLTYLIGLLGWQVNKHYSGGELFDIKLFAEAEKCCEHNCDCCDDTTDIYQLDVDQDIAQKPEVKIVSIDLFAQFYFVGLPKVEINIEHSKTARPPPVIPYINSISNLQKFLC